MTFTWCCQFVHGFLRDVGHKAYDGEDDKSSKHAGARVDAAYYDCIPEKTSVREEKSIIVCASSTKEDSTTLWISCSYL